MEHGPSQLQSERLEGLLVWQGTDRRYFRRERGWWEWRECARRRLKIRTLGALGGGGWSQNVLMC